MQIMEYAEQRIPVLNEFCVVCDEPHVFENGPMLRVSDQEETSSLYLNIFEFDRSNGYQCGAVGSAKTCSDQCVIIPDIPIREGLLSYTLLKVP